MLKWKVSKGGEGGEREGGDRETKGGAVLRCSDKAVSRSMCVLDYCLCKKEVLMPPKVCRRD